MMQTLFKIIPFIIIIVCRLMTVSADMWYDDFDADNPEAWNIVGNPDVWKVEDSFLHITVDRDWAVQYELYELIAFPTPYRDFSIIIQNIGGDKIRPGFCIGHRFPDTHAEDPFFYVFFTDEIRARRFDGKGSSHPFHTRLSREPRTRWNTDVLTTLELHFHSGLFLLFADGEFRAKFQDRNFNRADILGFVVEGINVANQWIGTGWVDSFSISAPNVTPKEKVTSAWAHLKQR